MPHRRTVYFISDRTGITAEMLGHSLLTQFEGVEFKRVTMPFIDTVEKAEKVAAQIRQCAEEEKLRPIIFSSIVNEALRDCIHVDCAMVIDFFEAFIGPLENEFGTRSSHSVGKSHGIVDITQYKARIDAVNFSMNHDDGVLPRDLEEADIILVGVSRSGKTPTCLYMALQYGLKAANYPLTPEDFGQPNLPKLLLPHRNKLFGLTISPERLCQIRTERKPDSKYASLDNCKSEVREAEALMRQHGVTYLDTTSKSIEELASTILHKASLSRKIY